MALELELHAKMGLEKMKQDAETERTKLKLGVETQKTHVQAATKVHDTHVRAVTAHDVAEIGAAAQLLNTNTEAAHNRAAAKELAKGAEEATKREI